MVGDYVGALAFWFSPQVASGIQCIVGLGNSTTDGAKISFDLNYFSNTFFVSTGGSTAISWTGIPAVGTWNNVVFARLAQGQSSRLWVNSRELNTATNNTPTVLSVASSTITIGNENTSASYPAYVLIDDIRLYNRALTLTEIRLLASRRGIGLQPLPDRAAGLPRRFSVNVGGTWRQADSYVNVGGNWRLGQPSVNVGGTWR
jgi:hypothetical protein